MAFAQPKPTRIHACKMCTCMCGILRCQIFFSPLCGGHTALQCTIPPFFTSNPTHPPDPIGTICGEHCCSHRVHTEWQWSFSGAYPLMMEKSAQPGENGGCTPTLFHYTVKKGLAIFPGWGRGNCKSFLPQFLLFPYMYSVVVAV